LHNPATAFLAAQLLPTAIGVFRNVKKVAYEKRIVDQIQHETERLGIGKLDLLRSGDTWPVSEQGAADRLLDWFARFATAEKVTDVFGN